jgi:hypothetical protein
LIDTANGSGEAGIAGVTSEMVTTLLNPIFRKSRH